MDLGDTASIILAILTAIYVFYTGRLNHHTRRSAKAAESSAAASQAATAAALETAQASQRAAEAAERSAALSEAATAVDFAVQSIVTTGSRTVVTLRSETANVHVFSVYVRLIIVPAASGSIREASGTTTSTNDQGQPGTFLHRGDKTFAFLAEPIAAGDTVFGHALVRYGFAPEPAGRERLVEINSQEVADVAGRSSED